MQLDEKINKIHYLVFERTEFFAQTMLNPFTMNELELNIIKPYEIVDSCAKSLIMQLRGELLKYKDYTNIDPIVIKQPKTWWDMFKSQYFPSWLLKKFPIEYREYTYNIRVDLDVLFPEFKYIPRDMGRKYVTLATKVEDNGTKQEV